MRLVLLSDTHGKHWQVNAPEGDVLIHAGDMTMAGEPDVTADFDLWLGKQPHKKKFVIAGNHDRNFFHDPVHAEALITNATYLRDTGIEYGGVKFWGSPWSPEFGGDFWVFQTKRKVEREQIWKHIPHDVDVLITHAPPRGICDKTVAGSLVGDYELRETIRGRHPKVHVFGHIHEAYGSLEMEDGPKFFNASILDIAYRVHNKPWVVDI